MPNLENAKKALRQSEKRAYRNKVVKAEIHSLRAHLRKALEAKNLEEAETLVKTLAQKLDKAHAKGVLKKNTAARYKSRMARKLKVAA
ncbi:30S ribosomal protein S20 [Candidatus Uhrbacteria bacterium]|nr:30S ribosomal protein S20 [Candidatus Uhrbacteria bacterium]